MEYGKTEMLSLLEQEPDMDEDCDAWSKWFDKLKEELSNHLGLFDSDIEAELKDVREELAGLKNLLKRHDHYRGKVVEPMVI